MSAAWTADVVGPCLRAAFHDCGTYSSVMCTEVFGRPTGVCGGCNGTFKREMEELIASNLTRFTQQNGMQLCYDFLWGTKNVAAAIRAHSGCASMTDADILNLSGMVAVQKSGGLPSAGCNWLPGRPDAAGVDETPRLPVSSSDATTLMAVFAGYEFDTSMQFFNMEMAETVATLSGAHTVGQSRVRPVGPNSMGIGSMTVTDTVFDGEYYAEVATSTKGWFGPDHRSVVMGTGNKGWFGSDRHGLCNELSDPTLNLKDRHCLDEASPFAPYYKSYAADFQANNDAAFFSKFCKTYQMMSNIGLAFDPTDYATNHFTITDALLAP
ncbi:heme peroxidase [Tribonema minus]|uniref:Heme peroxidase n=1 Tax=Tribonema minus TaxID=303371 RepID=A0A835Z804_9STRA|nr:heme peroxidase [Tribonema minus]